MGFKKHNWMEYGRRGDVVEISIKDSNGIKIDFFKSNDKENDTRIGRILKEKYGRDFSPEIKREESINKEKKEEKGFLEKDWEW